MSSRLSPDLYQNINDFFLVTIFKFPPLFTNLNILHPFVLLWSVHSLSSVVRILKTENSKRAPPLSTWFTNFLSLSRERPALNDVLLILDELVIWSDCRSDIFIISDKTIFLAFFLSNSHTPNINLLSRTNWGRDCTISILLFQTNMLRACDTRFSHDTNGLTFGYRTCIFQLVEWLYRKIPGFQMLFGK